jgi:hypothetical protein
MIRVRLAPVLRIGETLAGVADVRTTVATIAAPAVASGLLAGSSDTPNGWLEERRSQERPEQGPQGRAAGLGRRQRAGEAIEASIVHD